jgi:hypothetical protein
VQLNISSNYERETLTHTFAGLCGAEVTQIITSPITYASHDLAEDLEWDIESGWIS